MDASELPKSVRYIKNGTGGRWWPAAKAAGRLYGGWDNLPEHLLTQPDWPAIEISIREEAKTTGSGTADFNALKTLLITPSQHIWVTIEGQYLWWCAVEDIVEVGPKSTKSKGHFWLTCSRSHPWSNLSLDGKKELLLAKLPGAIGVSAGFKGTVCKPSKHEAIRRVILGEVNQKVEDAISDKQKYEVSVGALIGELHWKDFELLIDLILSRSGWARIERRGGNKGLVDIEAVNAVTSQTLAAQVKMQASQSDLRSFVEKAMLGDAQNLIFAYHEPRGFLALQEDWGPDVLLWDGCEVAKRALAAGLGEWIENRIV